MFQHASKGILCFVHGDDFVCVAERSSLRWMEEVLKGRFGVKTQAVGKRAAAGETQEARILNRVIRVTESSWE